MTILGIVLVLFIIYSYFNYLSKFKSFGRKSLKGPFPLPLVGNFHQLGTTRPHIPITKYHQQYGPIYRIWMGDVYTVVVNDIELVKKIMSDNTFINHPDTETFKYYSHHFSSLVFSKEEDWVEKRDLVAGALKKSKMKHIYELLDGQVDKLMSCMSYHAKAGIPFTPKSNLQRFSINSMLRLVLDKELPYEYQDIEADESMILILNQIDKVFVDLGTGKLGDYVDILRVSLRLYYNLFDKTLPSLRSTMDQEYQQHLDTFKQEYKESPRDLIDVFINNNDESKRPIYISMCLDLLFAGTETTSVSVEWSIISMANYPQFQEMAYQELVSVVGKDNNVTLSHRSQTPFLNAFIKESLRKGLPGAYGIPRVSSKDLEIDDYFIPKGSQLLINYHAISRNLKYWDNPETFDPTRHLTKHQEFPIWGYGARICLGQFFASDSLYLTISNILLKFKVSSIDGGLIDEHDNWGLTLHPNPFKIKLAIR
ncbi:hypothetical protein CYY_001437 [Polysphondylium violaceum]|uniref:Cytochrome P450 family protein n=1 Tax=Polysphondylium violaceum TaxID=133409 RepID=A0A8J4V460_9MYCE|nr:hypothetical protein CYY_001437 [Polysphondylium violaceum]